jgi:cephalosporin hydroxylase
VISIDVDPSANLVHGHPGIDFLIGDSGSLAVADAVRRRLPPDCGPLFAILDSDHAKAHVLRELNAFVPCCGRVITWWWRTRASTGGRYAPSSGRGLTRLCRSFLPRNPTAFVPDHAREAKFGITFAPAGYLLKT